MAWQKSTWNNVIGTSGSKVTVNAGNSASGIINTNLAIPLKFLDLTIRCLVDFGGTPDGNAEIVVYGRDFLGSNISDTVPVYRQDIESIVSDKQIITLPNIDVSSLDSFNIVVLNKDTLDPIDVWVSFMYGYIDEASVAGPDEKVKVSYNDTTPDYLENKLKGEAEVIDVTVQDEGANESLKISLDSTKFSNWNAAYGWGDHALAGYLTEETDPIAMDVFGNTKEPTGFVDRTSSELSFSDENLRLSLAVKAPADNFKYYINGTLYTKTTTQTADITDTEGLWYFYFNGDTLIATQIFPGMETCLVALIYWDATSNTAIFIGDERHGCVMDSSTHGYLHNTIGARFSSGLGITINILGDGSSNSHAQIALDNGDIYDEDILIDIHDGSSGLFVQDLTPIAQIPVFWRSGVNGDWKKDTATDYPMKQGTDRIQYNLYSGGSWSATDITVNDRYAVMWIVATDEIANPVIAILGQGDYSSLALAQAASYTGLSLGTLPTKEMKLLYKLIIQTSTGYANTPKARFREVIDYRQTTTEPVGGSVITDHNSLSGRSDASTHPAASIDTDVTNFNDNLSSADDTVQKALDTLDNYYPEKHFRAEDLRNPNSADWAVNSLADLGADGSNNGIDARFFDDTTNEGVGFSIFVPSFATNIILKFISRAATAPAATKKVDLGLYFRGVPNNGAVAAWSLKKDITNQISIPTNVYYQYDTVTLSIATLGITVNRLTHFELIRDAQDSGHDTLVGDWLLTSLRVSFS